MTFAEYASLGERYAYYRGRARYLSTAARLAADLIDRKRLRTALELGPHARPGPKARLIYVFEHLDRAPAAGPAPPIERPARLPATSPTPGHG